MPITIDLEKDPFYLEGVERAKREDAIRLYKKTKWTPEEIAEILNIPVEKVREWLKEEGIIKADM